MMATPTRIASRSFCSVLMILMVACGGEPSGPEAKLEAWLDDVHAAAEAKDRGAIMERISPAYVDGRGNSRTDIGNLLRLYFLRANHVEFVPAIDEIRILAGTAAEVSLTVAMAGTNVGRFGIQADAYRFELELEMTDDEWRLISAKWAAVGQAPH